ncbi:signal peptidase I [Paenibacillus sp. R14(2021)]|uniref:signal peptidase I n=1 Tax=Paenibacillus sp. R14(2021) TaxID=2859228 RepID=UPI001C61377A|nr:signal peptidase I [Paenibacillus sp. R14(2021)]
MNAGPGTDYPQEAEQAALGPRKNRASTAKRPKGSKERSEPELTNSRKSAKPFPEWAAELRDWGVTLLVAVVVVLCMHYFVFNLSTVEGQSMEPSLYEKEWLFVNKISYLTGSPSAGDVVILKDPAETAQRKEYLVKRIIGVPGDKIEVRDGQLYRNGKLVVEPYTDVQIEDLDYGPETIAAGHYFVMGDNRHAKASRDSRSFHAVPRSYILGRADLIIWPITKWGRL